MSNCNLIYIFKRTSGFCFWKETDYRKKIDCDTALVRRTKCKLMFNCAFTKFYASFAENPSCDPFVFIRLEFNMKISFIDFGYQ